MRGYEHVATEVPTWVMTAANRTMAAAAQMTGEIIELVPDGLLSRYLSGRLRALCEVLVVRYTTATHADPLAMSQEALIKRVDGDRDKAAALADDARAAVPVGARSPALDDRFDTLRVELAGRWMINFEEERRG